MEAIQRKTIDNAIKLLTASKDTVRWAVEFDGEAYGNAELAAVKSGRSGVRKFVYGRFETLNHFRPYVEHLAVGDVAKVPFLHFDGAVLATHISAAATRWFGKGNYATHKNDKEACIEIMRVG